MERAGLCSQGRASCLMEKICCGKKKITYSRYW